MLRTLLILGVCAGASFGLSSVLLGGGPPPEWQKATERPMPTLGSADQTCDPAPLQMVRDAVQRADERVVSLTRFSSKQELEGFVAANQDEIARAMEAVSRTLKPDYSKAKDCFKKSDATRRLTVLFDWQVEATPDALVLSQPRLVPPTKPEEKALWATVERCSAPILERAPIRLTAAPAAKFFAYSGRAPIPMDLPD